jgi:hypothetical protein
MEHEDESDRKNHTRNSLKSLPMQPDIKQEALTLIAVALFCGINVRHERTNAPRDKRTLINHIVAAVERKITSTVSLVGHMIAADKSCTLQFLESLDVHWPQDCPLDIVKASVLEVQPAIRKRIAALVGTSFASAAAVAHQLCSMMHFRSALKEKSPTGPNTNSDAVTVLHAERLRH